MNIIKVSWLFKAVGLALMMLIIPENADSFSSFSSKYVTCWIQGVMNSGKWEDRCSEWFTPKRPNVIAVFSTPRFNLRDISPVAQTALFTTGKLFSDLAIISAATEPKISDKYGCNKEGVLMAKSPNKANEDWRTSSIVSLKVSKSKGINCSVVQELISPKECSSRPCTKPSIKSTEVMMKSFSGVTNPGVTLTIFSISRQLLKILRALSYTCKAYGANLWPKETATEDIHSNKGHNSLSSSLRTSHLDSKMGKILEICSSVNSILSIKVCKAS
ncbi:hypothetical protein WICPIJ_006576 [Wickerhamomyces pijperi]|uniref:Secreted protein n=1 Tax=Wickerhamomyces pijperi TaxID=599730 RepID=A0A9P8Q1G6_WICPI|nr:hypothetical protein WICPIJ_006576 [Wickerhamomyces pijperi]